MAKSQGEHTDKGSFGGIRLPVAKKYIFPISRKRIMAVGGICCMLISLYYAADALLFRNTFISSGPLSASHAGFESDCARCHDAFVGITSSKCSTCHEKTNDAPGVYSFAAHYIYRSEDAARIPAAKQQHAGDEQLCASCHPDHNGRRAPVTRVPDSRCSSCHFSSFQADHPEFAFARTRASDDSTLKMTHVLHTKEVLKLLNTPNVEQACLHCHEAEADGKGFKPLDFDAHCGDCHLTANVETSSLPMRDPADPASVGVETLEMIQRRRGPGTTWAYYTNPNEFSISGSRVKKSPVYHRDPWILENLKQLSRMLQTETTLADLLDASGGDLRKNNRAAYREAIGALQDYITGLRSRPEPEIQSELAAIDSLLEEARSRVLDGKQPLPVLPGLAPLTGQDTFRQEIDEFVQKVARPCLQCHYADARGLLAVQARQRSLTRSEFDHRAHIIDRRCLDCHNIIPVGRALEGDTTGVKSVDVAATYNLPNIATCFECHTESAGLSSCVSCHFMHPNKQQRGNLQLFVERK